MYLLAAIWIFDLLRLLLPQPSVTVPFSVDRKGKVAAIALHVPRDAPYSFDLDLGFDGGSARVKLQSLVGDGSRSPAGKTLNNGIPIPVELKISQVSGSVKTDIFDREFSDLELSGWSDSAFMKEITGMPLRAGDYEIRVSSLEDIPQFNDVPITFHVYMALRK